MYATAHRVTRQGRDGINSFLYLNGPDFDWPSDPKAAVALAPTQPGRLQKKVTELAPGNNDVRSYLDVLARDGTASELLREALRALLQDVMARENPTVFAHRGVILHFGVQLSLEDTRQAELARLVEGLERVLPEGA